MNYAKIYENLITSRKLFKRNKKDGNYYESHHVIPQSLGGSNDKTNLILLTAKEHYFAHILLSKMFTGIKKSKMVYALWRLSTSKSENQKKSKVSSRQYEQARKLYIETLKNRPISEKCLSLIRERAAKRKGKKLDPKIGRKISQTKKSQIHWRLKGISNVEMYGEKKALDIKNKISKKLKGRSYVELHGKEEADRLKEECRKRNLGKKENEETKLKRKNTFLNKSEDEKNKKVQKFQDTWQRKKENLSEDELIQLKNYRSKISKDFWIKIKKDTKKLAERSEKLRLANSNKTVSEETKNKIRLALKGKKRSKESIEKMINTKKLKNE